jgi:DNA polymerase
MTPSPPDDPALAGALESLLRWYVAMGVDAAIAEEPRDHFADVEIAKAETAPAPEPTRPAPRPALTPPASAGLGAPPRPAAEAPPASAETLIRAASERAAAAQNLDALRQAWEGFEGCALAATASRMILSAGTPGSRVMLIGAAPGSDDERQGEAFAGPAGRLVDAMLASIGLSRETVYLANLIPWRPPGNRPPTPLEAALCLPFARRHIALANPAIILCLGERAAQVLLDTRETLSRLRGRWHAYEGEDGPVRLAVTFSPDYLLSQPLQKRRAWRDLLDLALALEAPAADGRKSHAVKFSPA